MKTIVWTSTNIPATAEVRRGRRPIGRDADAFQSMMVNYESVARWADELGFEAFGSAEHHFQTEGGDVLPNSLLMFAKLAAQTQQIMFIPLSVILPAHNPIRVAEDLAQFDHMFPGRIGVSLGRGYQQRWMQTLIQDESVTALNPQSDARNREMFDEYVEVIERAWTEDSFSYRGKYFQVPYPAEGIAGWPLTAWTRDFGDPGEVDDDGTVRRIGVLPKPLNRLPIFVPGVASQRTVTDAARNGRVLLSVANRGDIRPMAEMYRDAARESGRDLPLGKGIGLVRKVWFGDTFEEAFDLAVETSGYLYHELLGPYGINEGLRVESDPPGFPLTFSDARALTQRMYEKGALFVGTENQVREQVAEMLDEAGGDVEWLVYEFHAPALTRDDMAEIERKQLESYAASVLSAFR